MTELLKCPFCGGDALLEVVPPHKHIISTMPDYEGGAFIECAKCNCAMSGSTAEEITEAWNTRKPVQDVLERLGNELRLADEEKERCARESQLQFDSAKGYAVGIYNAIEIVKEGLK